MYKVRQNSKCARGRLRIDRLGCRLHLRDALGVLEVAALMLLRIERQSAILVLRVASEVAGVTQIALARQANSW
jgi:hypothetical protein